MTAKIKYFEENYVNAKLESVQYQAKLNMQAVLRQINEMGDNRSKVQMGAEDANVTTLKDAVIVLLLSLKKRWKKIE